MSSNDDMRNELRTYILQFYKQLSTGCGRPVCSNSNCASNPEADHLETEELKKRSLELGAQYLKSQRKKLKLDESPRLCTPPPPFFTVGRIRQLIDQQDHIPLRRYIGEVLASPEGLSQSFLHEGLAGVADHDQSGVDLNAVTEGFQLIYGTEADELFQSSLERALLSIRQELRSSRSYEEATNLRQLIIFLHNPMLGDPSTYGQFLVPLATCLGLLPKKGWKIIVHWIYAGFNDEKLRILLHSVQTMLSMRVLDEDQQHPIHADDHVHWGAEFLRILHTVNQKKGEPIPYVEFYNDAVNERLVEGDELARNFIVWKQNEDPDYPESNNFTICNYFFLMDPFIKSRMLFYDCRTQQHAQRGFPSILRRNHFILRIDRHQLIDSALNQVEASLEDDPGAFKRQLRIAFLDEEGIDEGGVQKEFFQLIIKELFDAQYGMFILNEETQCYWMNHTSTDTREFQLIGILLGLAIYNGVILDVHFPFVMYKKLMGVPLTFADIKEVEPTLSCNLQRLLEYNRDDVEETFSLYFQVTYEYFGESVSVDLKEGGSNIPVTQANKGEYVELYSKWILEKSVEKQFDAFFTGFKQVCDGIFFSLFRVEEVELLICGDPQLDFEALESVTEYNSGYSEDSPVIKNFWKTVHSLGAQEQRQFLFFATGSDRAPIGGLKNLRFEITKHGEDGDQLPQAHTCFNILLLPPYSTEEKLRDRLLLAIQNSTGFGML